MIWLASDDGTDLTLTTDGGSLLYQSAGGDLMLNNVVTGFYDLNSNSIVGGADTLVGEVSLAGQRTFSDPWVLGNNGSGVGTGSSFGFRGAELIVPSSSFPAGAVTVTPSSSVVFSGLTVNTAFGTNLDLGPVL